MDSRTARHRTLGLVAGLLVMLAGCGGGAISSPLPSGAAPPADCARPGTDGVIAFSADNLRFAAPCIVAPAGEAFTIRFTNDDSEPHNVRIFQDETRSTELFNFDVVMPSADPVDYVVDPPLEAGEYYFDCAVHPSMSGTLYVVAG